jgi:hypothetical protein
MITLSTNRKATQSIENVDNLIESIQHYYQVNHIKKLNNGEHAFSFGHHPIREHHITYSPFFDTKSELKLSKIKTDFIKKITGFTVRELGQAQNSLRKEKGHSEANNFENTFQEKLNEFFHCDCISLSIDTYQSPSASLIINIESLTHDVLDAISEILKHTEMLPKSQSSRKYEL